MDRIAYADGREVKLSYNPLRQLVKMEDWLGITRIENDAAGRALKVQYPDGKEVSYTYGKSGERTGITYPDGRKAEYLYDEEVRLSGLDDGNGMIRYRYDEAGRLSRKTFPNGMETSYLYNTSGYLAELAHRDKEGILDRYRYQYDLTGNKTAIEKQRRGLPEESGIYAYGYDAPGRLSSVAKDGQSLRTYEYDAFGNRSLLKEGSRETSYVYNVLNQLVSRADAMQEETYIYDKRGNLSFIKADGALKNRYTYGAINRLEQAENGEGEAASYTYNGLGHRVGKTAGPETKIQYTIDLTKSYHNLLQKEEGGDVQTYLWDGNIAGIVGDNSRRGRYYLNDELGSPIRLLSESGEPEESYGYDEFGQDLYGNQGATQPFGYTGYQADRTAGTYYAQAREYRAELGRFAAVDTIKGAATAPYTLNVYGYCWNNPMMFVDLDGQWPQRLVNNLEKARSFFNTYIYGEKEIVKKTKGKLTEIAYPYHIEEESVTIQNENFTGSILVKETIFTNDTQDIKYSINIPTFDLGNGKSIGIPISVGISGGYSGINISTSVGVDFIANKISVNGNIGFNPEDLVSVKVNADTGWLKNKVGFGLKLPFYYNESLRIFGYHQGMIDEIRRYDEYGVHVKMGVAYVVAIVVFLFYGVATGMYDIETAFQSFQQYWNGMKECIK